MSLPYLKLDSTTTEFVVSDWEQKEHRFAGTIHGAVELINFCHSKHLQVLHSSDLNHPDEFPKFQEHAIDVAVGYYEGAVNAGLISLGE